MSKCILQYSFSVISLIIYIPAFTILCIYFPNGIYLNLTIPFIVESFTRVFLLNNFPKSIPTIAVQSIVCICIKSKFFFLGIKKNRQFKKKPMLQLYREISICTQILFPNHYNLEIMSQTLFFYKANVF